MAGAKKGRKVKKSVEGHIRGGRRRKEWQRGRRKKGKGKGEEKRERELLSLCPSLPVPFNPCHAGCAKATNRAK